MVGAQCFMKTICSCWPFCANLYSRFHNQGFVMNAGQVGLESSRPESSRPGSTRPGPT